MDCKRDHAVKNPRTRHLTPTLTENKRPKKKKRVGTLGTWGKSLEPEKVSEPMAMGQKRFSLATKRRVACGKDEAFKQRTARTHAPFSFSSVFHPFTCQPRGYEPC